MMKLVRNSLGMSAMELVVGTALFAGVSVVVMKTMSDQNLTMVKNQQNLDLESMLKGVSDHFKKKANCDLMIGGMKSSDIDGMVMNKDNTTQTFNYEQQNCRAPRQPSEVYSVSETSFEQDQDMIQMNDSDSLNQNSDYIYYRDIIYPQLLEQYESCLREEREMMARQETETMGEHFKMLNPSFEEEFAGNLKLEKIEFNMGPVPAGQAQDVTLNIQYDFKKRKISKVKDGEEKTRDVIRNIVTTINVDENGMITCPGYMEEQITNEGVKQICLKLGGQVSAVSGACEFSTISSEWERVIKRAVCVSLTSDQSGGLTADFSKCSKILLQENLIGGNISPSHVDVSGGSPFNANRREGFSQQNCSGNFMSGSNITTGQPTCKGVVFQCTGAGC